MMTRVSVVLDDEQLDQVICDELEQQIEHMYGNVQRGVRTYEVDLKKDKREVAKQLKSFVRVAQWYGSGLKLNEAVKKLEEAYEEAAKNPDPWGVD
jgi:hypothetical protein